MVWSNKTVSIEMTLASPIKLLIIRTLTCPIKGSPDARVQVKYPQCFFVARSPKSLKTFRVYGHFSCLSTGYQWQVDTKSLKYFMKKNLTVVRHSVMSVPGCNGPKTFLSCCVPDLKFDRLSVELNGSEKIKNK